MDGLSQWHPGDWLIHFVACNNQFKEQLARMLCLNAGTRAPTMPSLLEIQQLLPDLSK
jgi:hypothetical protein